MNVTAIALPDPVPARRRAIPFLFFLAVLALRSAIAPSEGFDVRWLYGVQALGAGALLLAWRARYVEIGRAPAPDRQMGIAILAGLALFVLWVAPQPSWMTRAGADAAFVPVDAGGQLRWDLIALRTLGAVAVVPVMEELFWRSFLMRWIDTRSFLDLDPRRVSRFALLASSLVFALGHDRWAAALLAGLVYGELYRRGGNLWRPIAAHAVTNACLAAWVVGRQQWGFW